MNQSTQVIINASAHQIPLPGGFFHTVCTSPPYYSLRSYAGQQEVDWPAVSYSPMPGLPPLEIEPMTAALGLESTPEAYIGHLVACFREVKRVLRNDGTVWIVMGDSYFGDSPTRKRSAEAFSETWDKSQTASRGGLRRSAAKHHGCGPGNLMLIPHRLALALQADGWVVRNDAVWHKKSPMPESVAGWRWERCMVKTGKTEGVLLTQDTSPGAFTAQSGGSGPMPTWSPCPGCDKCQATGGYVLRRGSWRHTRAHETVLMLSRSMGYYADQERVMEENKWPDHNRFGNKNADARLVRELIGNMRHGAPEYTSRSGRNPRSVLTPRPESYSGSHYAVYPRTLITPLLRATAPTRVCPVCGAPWCPVVERTEQEATSHKGSYFDRGKTGVTGLGRVQDGARFETVANGHRPTCDCIRKRKPDSAMTWDAWQDVIDEVAAEMAPLPGWCLDPFAGTFTTGAVCAELGVNAVGLDISCEYLDEHAKPRIGQTPASALETLPLFEGIQAR